MKGNSMGKCPGLQPIGATGQRHIRIWSVWLETSPCPRI